MNLEAYLLIAGAIMTLLVTSRPAMKALREYGTDFVRLARAARRAALGDVILEVHTLTQHFEEHETDVSLHPRRAVAAAAARRQHEEEQ